MTLFEHAKKRLRNEGFSQVASADRRARLLQRFGKRIAARQDHVEIGPPFEEAGQQFRRTPPGRMDHIEQDQIDLVHMLREEAEGLDAIGSRPDAITGPFKHASHQSQERILVIDDESGSRRRHVPLFRGSGRS